MEVSGIDTVCFLGFSVHLLVPLSFSDCYALVEQELPQRRIEDSSGHTPTPVKAILRASTWIQSQ